MSASNPNSAVYLTDSSTQVKNKINKYAFSGGGATAEIHKAEGGNTEVDISFQYLKFFMEDDEKLKQIESEYKSGTMSTSDLKKICIDVLSNLVTNVQEVCIRIHYGKTSSLLFIYSEES